MSDYFQPILLHSKRKYVPNPILAQGQNVKQFETTVICHYTDSPKHLYCVSDNLKITAGFRLMENATVQCSGVLVLSKVIKFRAFDLRDT